ncbi:immunity 49 family protein [Kitasatospora sp. NPDC057198]|uniref:immunity 49 family protein n=1 Tax=Kitasatospora sp. NPDC057198 TaxID=3346046 RepID=UPI00363B828F
MQVSRHELAAVHGSQEVLERLTGVVREMVAGMPDFDYDRAEALGYSLDLAKRRCVEDPRCAKLETWHAWVLPMQIGSALFESATAASGPVTCRVGTENGEVLELPATGPQEYLHPVLWLEAFYLAVICREEERMAELAEVPTQFLRDSGVRIDEYVYDWIDTLKLASAGRPRAWESLLRAIEGTAPERTRAASTEVMLKLLYPPLELFQLFIRREVEAFNDSLATALTWHKEYWTGNEARSTKPEGFVALAPLAVAVLAYDAGMEIEVESQYLPHHLLHGTWVGEFPTR